MSGDRTGTGLRIALLALLIVVWSSTWAAIKIGLQGIPPFAGVALRFTIAGALLVALFKPLGGRIEGSRREWLLWLANALLTFSISYGVVYWAEQWLPSGLTSILFATFPFFVAGMAHFWLPRERLTVRGVGGLLLGFAGVLAIFSEDLGALVGEGADHAARVMLLSPLAAAAGNVIIKRWGKGVHPLSLTAIPMLMTGVLMGLLAAVVDEPPMRLDGVAIAALLYLAVVGSAVTFTLYFWLLERLPATQLSLIAYCVPVMAMLIGVLFLGERLAASALLGASLVVVGVALGSGGRRATTPIAESTDRSRQ